VSHEIEWIGEPAALTRIAPEWDRLAVKVGVPFVAHAWVDAWWLAFGAGRELRVCTARREGQLVGALPLVARGRVLSSATNAHTPVFAPLGADDAVEAVADAASIDHHRSLVVTHLPSGGTAAHILADASLRAGRLTWIEPGQLSPLVDTSGEVDDYHGRLARHTRRELLRLRRKLEAEQSAVVRTLATPSDLGTQLDAFFALEARGWKGRRGTAIISSERTTAFYRAVAAGFAERGELRISTIEADGRLIAFDLGLVSAGRLWVLKGSYDEAYRRYAPGLLLLLAEIERAFELGLDAVELLGDAEPYKRKFATDFRPHCAVHSHRRRLVPIAWLSYRRLARPVLRRAYRRIRPR
jgi:CelD/BcsL family acetyltransferase involved in cellulose biosynthesis